MVKESELIFIAGLLSFVTSFTTPSISTSISTTVHSDRTSPPMSKSTPDDVSVTNYWSTTLLVGQTRETPILSTPGKSTTVTQTANPVSTFESSTTLESTSIEPVTPGLTTEKPIQMSSTILTSTPTGSPSTRSSESSVSGISPVTVYVTRVSSITTSSDPFSVSASASTSSYVISVNSGQPQTSPSTETALTSNTELPATGSSQPPTGGTTVIVASALAATIIIVGAGVLVLVIVLWRKNRLPCHPGRKTNESRDLENRQSYFPNHANPLFNLKSPIDQQLPQ